MQIICKIKKLLIHFIQNIRNYGLFYRINSIENIKSGSRLNIVRLVGKRGQIRLVCFNSLKKGDIIEVTEGEIIPCDGEIIEGIATVDESVITGESAFVVREAGGELSKVTAGTKVLCNTIRIKITSSIKANIRKEYAEKNKAIRKVNHINFEM